MKAGDWEQQVGVRSPLGCPIATRLSTEVLRRTDKMRGINRFARGCAAASPEPGGDLNILMRDRYAGRCWVGRVAWLGCIENRACRKILSNAP